MNEDTLIIRKTPLEKPESETPVPAPESEDMRSNPQADTLSSALTGGILGSAAAAIWVASDPLIPAEPIHSDPQQSPAPEIPETAPEKLADKSPAQTPTDGQPQSPSQENRQPDEAEFVPAQPTDNPEPNLPKEDQALILHGITEAVKPASVETPPSSEDFSGVTQSVSLIPGQEITAMGVSKDADEFAEAIFIDHDGDGLYDEMYLDTDGDNQLDAHAVIYQDERGVSDLEKMETPMISPNFLNPEARPISETGNSTEQVERPEPEWDGSVETPGFDNDYDVEGDGWL